jgi:hypothetical protein
MVEDACLHRRRHAERLMDAGEIVVEEEQRHHRRVVLQLLAEGVCQAGDRRIDIRIARRGSSKRASDSGRR